MRLSRLQEDSDSVSEDDDGGCGDSEVEESRAVAAGVAGGADAARAGGIPCGGYGHGLRLTVGGDRAARPGPADRMFIDVHGAG